MASWNIGSGGDYATWALALTALQAASPLGEDYTLTQISDTVEPGISVTVDLNQHNVVLDSSSPHQGNPTQGWKSTASGLSADMIGITIQGAVNTGQFTIRNLDLRAVYTADNYSILHLVADGQTDFLVHDLILDATGSTGNVTCLTTGPGGSVTGLANVNLFNIVGGNAYRFGFMTQDGSSFPQTYMDNCTFFSCSEVGVDADGYSIVFRRSLGLGSPTSGVFANVNAAVGYHCASEDDTADDFLLTTSAQINVTPSDEIVSTDITSADYGKVKGVGVCHDGGANANLIAGNDHGIRQNDRPQANGDWSIGADEYAAISGGGGGSGGGLSGAISAAMAAGY